MKCSSWMFRWQSPALQVFHLKEAGIECGYLSGSQSYEEQRSVMDALKHSPPSVRIVFVTPEKVARSDNLMRLFDTLHQHGQLVSPLRADGMIETATLLITGQKSI